MSVRRKGNLVRFKAEDNVFLFLLPSLRRTEED